jgi:hypothetical protein
MKTDFLVPNVARLWMVDEGVWVPVAPTHEWFKQFITGTLLKNWKEVAQGNVVAKRSRYATPDPGVEYIVEWR